MSTLTDIQHHHQVYGYLNIVQRRISLVLNDQVEWITTRHNCSLVFILAQLIVVSDPSLQLRSFILSFYVSFCFLINDMSRKTSKLYNDYEYVTFLTVIYIDKENITHVYQYVGLGKYSRAYWLAFILMIKSIYILICSIRLLFIYTKTKSIYVIYIVYTKNETWITF